MSSRNTVKFRGGPAAVILIFDDSKLKSLLIKCHLPDISGWEGRQGPGEPEDLIERNIISELYGKESRWKRYFHWGSFFILEVKDEGGSDQRDRFIQAA